jgi:hypothetical protein
MVEKEEALAPFTTRKDEVKTSQDEAKFEAPIEQKK